MEIMAVLNMFEKVLVYVTCKHVSSVILYLYNSNNSNSQVEFVP